MATQITLEHNGVTHHPSFKAYRVLHVGFVVAPLLAGLDKFFNYMVDWSQYLSPIISNMIAAETFMKIVGVIEILAALLVLFKPKIGGYVVAAWLIGIVINLLSIPGYYDIALRDFGLSLGALAFAFLSEEYGH
jgi:hypothetical protein